jgi:uncharacterized tellurite resistance protein B-like protein
MKNQEFKLFLFRSAVIAMACDGDIADSEIETIKNLADNEIFFLGLEYEELLEKYVNEIKLKGKVAINNYLTELASFQLNSYQELQLIDLILIIVNADNRAEEKELKFLHIVISRMKLDQETLIIEFPKYIEQLMGFKNYGLQTEFIDEIEFKI